MHKITIPGFALGTRLGHHQAFGLLANKCSTAEAHALREIRDQKLYLETGLSWEEFCPVYAGMSSKTADRIIDNLEEFGDTYFNLKTIINLPAPQYRAIAPAIEDNTVEFEGRRIPITRENTAELVEAVRGLRAQLQKRNARKQPDPIARAGAQMNRTLGQISAILLHGIAAEDRGKLHSIMNDAFLRMKDLYEKI